MGDDGGKGWWAGFRLSAKLNGHSPSLVDFQFQRNCWVVVGEVAVKKFIGLSATTTRCARVFVFIVCTD